MFYSFYPHISNLYSFKNSISIQCGFATPSNFSGCEYGGFLSRIPPQTAFGVILESTVMLPNDLVLASWMW